jgi:hypothetical protein
MKPISKTTIDGVLFILFGVYIAWVWFVATFVVVARLWFSSHGTYMVPRTPTVAEALVEWLKIPWVIQSVFFLLPIIFFITWGIWTLKRTSKHKVEPTRKPPVE